MLKLFSVTKYVILSTLLLKSIGIMYKKFVYTSRTNLNPVYAHPISFKSPLTEAYESLHQQKIKLIGGPGKRELWNSNKQVHPDNDV